MRLLLWILLCSVLAAGQDVAFVTLTPQGVVKVHEGAGRERRRMSPCSTYKIPHAVIALETGVIPSPDYVIKYDEKKHKTLSFWVDAWSKDQDLRSAFRVSAVWYFREIAQRAGRGNSQAFLDRFGYGNRDLSAWPDMYWIGSTLRISPVEQAEFLDRLFRNEFGITPRHVAAVEDFMRQEEKDGRVLYYKTGACTDKEAGPEVWLAGFVQNGKERTYFVLNAGGKDLTSLIAQRVEIARLRLAKYGLWPSEN